MSVRVRLEPLGESIEAESGASLQDLLFGFGVEFPCGGKGRCKRCRVKVLEGSLDACDTDRLVFTAEELAEGWRLACRAKAECDLTLDIAQWETTILADDTRFAFQAREGLGVAVDLGTTTLVAQLLDLETAHVLGVRTALNPQVAYGSDVMSRVEYALGEGKDGKLRRLIRAEIGRMVGDLLAAAHLRDYSGLSVAIVGNTVMHHLFCGVDVEPLSHAPFHPDDDGWHSFRAEELGWRLPLETNVRFLPCLGGFVGSDILAGILAVQMAESGRLVCLVDLGTNGEIVVGNRERILCASTAAGPAFEGGRISAGMRAATGAIAEVQVADGRMLCHVLGGGAPRGVCGSGLVDVVAAGLDLGLILPRGRLAGGSELVLAEAVRVTQADIRQVQLAKAAIAAGLRILLRLCGAEVEGLSRLYLAGAFGNYVNRASARRIGLIDAPPDIVEPAGNTALLGAKLSLFDAEAAIDAIRARAEHVPLAADPLFHETYVDSMYFPG